VSQTRGDCCCPTGGRDRTHQEAYDAIVATLQRDAVARRPIGKAKGEYLIHLDAKTVDRLTALRHPGESYSDVIVRLAELSKQA
jgi:hypothetical protein